MWKKLKWRKFQILLLRAKKTSEDFGGNNPSSILKYATDNQGGWREPVVLVVGLNWMTITDNWFFCWQEKLINEAVINIISLKCLNCKEIAILMQFDGKYSLVTCKSWFVTHFVKISSCCSHLLIFGFTFRQMKTWWPKFSTTMI